MYHTSCISIYVYLILFLPVWVEQNRFLSLTTTLKIDNCTSTTADHDRKEQIPSENPSLSWVGKVGMSTSLCIPMRVSNWFGCFKAFSMRESALRWRAISGVIISLGAWFTDFLVRNWNKAKTKTTLINWSRTLFGAGSAGAAAPSTATLSAIDTNSQGIQHEVLTVQGMIRMLILTNFSATCH